MKKYLLTLLTAVIYAMAAWAQTSVSTDSELREAVKTDGANIIVTADIDLSNSTLEIASNKSVTINLNGHTLSRNLSWRGDGGGQVITVREGATLNLSNGTLKGGWGGGGGGMLNNGTANLMNVTIKDNIGDDRGGGICNYGLLTMHGGAIIGNITRDKTSRDFGHYPSDRDNPGGGGIYNHEGATATLTGVTISGNKNTGFSGGGICNKGTLTIDGGTITGNKARKLGGGIWNTGTLNVRGAITLTGNTASSGMVNNLYLTQSAIVTVTGSLEGSTIGMSLHNVNGTFTSGYSTYHSGTAPSTYFSGDLSEIVTVSTDGNYEAQLESTLAEGSIYYIERSWDGAKVNAEIKVLAQGDYDVLTGSDGERTIGAGYHVVKNNITVSGGVNVSINSNDDTSYLILCDGARLTTPYVCVKNGDASGQFHIYGQMGDTGEVYNQYSQGEDDYPGVGSLGYRCTINIHGGHFDIDAGKDAAGIGGGTGSCGGTLNILGGEFDVHGGGNAAGIGGGKGAFCNNTNIYGGRVYAYSGYDAAGIGGGNDGNGLGVITIYDGLVMAGGDDGAGIGGGDCGPGGTIIINGGDIYATGYLITDDENGAGIGGGVQGATGDITINGGFVEAHGGNKGAGIGSGEDCTSSSGSLTINGGYVYAEGINDGAGIGGGQGAPCFTIAINGGTVIAQSGGDQHAIGPGIGSDIYSSLAIADNLGVFVTTNLYRSEKMKRIVDCRNFAYVRIKTCGHGGATFSIVDAEKHAISGCDWCSAGDEAHTFGSDGDCGACGLIRLLDVADNGRIIAHWDGQAKSVALSGRTLYKDGNWNTICLPFDVDDFDGTIFADATVKKLDVDGKYDTKQTSFDTSDGTLYLYFKDADEIEAGKPYLVKWSSDTDITDPMFRNVEIDDDLDTVESEDGKVFFKGNFDTVTLEANDKSNLYMGDGNTLYWPSEDRTLNAFRAYFHVNLSGVSEVRSIRMNLSGKVTSINNEQLTINNCAGAWFDLFGRKLNGKPKQKGMYIHDGKAVVVSD